MGRFFLGLGLLLAIGACAWLGGVFAAPNGFTADPGPTARPAASPAPALLAIGEDTPPAGPGLGVLREHDDTPRGPSVVQVLAAQGAPRQGAPVRVTWPGGRRAWRVTDGDGRIAFESVRLDGSVRVEAFAGYGRGVGDGAPRVPPVGSVRLTQPEHTLRCRGTMGMHVTFVDAESGRILPAPSWRPLPLVDGAAERGPSRSREPRQAALVLPGQQPLGEELALGIDVGDDLPRGYVAWDATTWQPEVSRYASSLEVVYPLRREARVHVRAEEHDGTPTDRFEVYAFEIAHRRVTRSRRGEAWHVTPDPDGVWLGGVPFLRGRPIAVDACRPVDPAARDEDFVLVPGPLDIATGEGRIARFAQIATRIVVRFPEAPGNLFFGPSSHHCIGIGGTACCGRRVKDEPPGDVIVTVRRADGRPAPGARVWCAGRLVRTDFEGRARFHDLLPCKTVARIAEPGLVDSRVSVEVRSGRTVVTTLREAAGGTLQVRVLGPDGDPVPFARLGTTESAHWVDLHDGVQRIDPFTDEDGVRTLRRFPAGTWRITASWGGLHGKATVAVKDGAVQDVVVTVKPVKE